MLIASTIVSLAAGLLLAQPAIPSSPRKLSYKPLDWKVPSGSPYRKTLPNGLKLYIAEDKSLPLIELSGYVYGGTLNDPQGKEGLTALAINLMRTGGTVKFRADSLDALIDLLAIKIGLAPDESNIGFSCSFLSEFTDSALMILSQVLFQPTFEKEKIEKERAIFLENIKHRFDNPPPILDIAYDKALYPHELNSRITTEKSIKAITRNDLLALHKRFFRTENMILAVSGKFNADTFALKLDKLFPKAVSSQHDSLVVNIAPAPKDRCLIVHKQISQCYIRLGLPLFKRPNPDYYAVSVLDQILGGDSFTSRLGSKIRSDEGLTYSIYSSAESNYIYPATYMITFFTKTETAAKAIDLIDKEVLKMRDSGVTDAELKDAKQVLIESFPAMFRTPYDIVKNYAFNEYYARSPEHFKHYPDSIHAVSKDDVKRMAQKYLDPARFTYVVVGDTSAIFKHDSSGAFSFSKLAPHITSPDSLSKL